MVYMKFQLGNLVMVFIRIYPEGLFFELCTSKSFLSLKKGWFE